MIRFDNNSLRAGKNKMSLDRNSLTAVRVAQVRVALPAEDSTRVSNLLSQSHRSPDSKGIYHLDGCNLSSRSMQARRDESEHVGDPVTTNNVVKSNETFGARWHLRAIMRSRPGMDPVVLLHSSLTGSHPSLICGLTEHPGVLLGDDRRCKVLFKPLPGTESQAAPEVTIRAKTFQYR
jgi:hypothetical protein